MRDLPAILSGGEGLEVRGDNKGTVLVNETIQGGAARSTVKPKNSRSIGRVILRLNKPIVKFGSTISHIEVTGVLLGGKLSSPSRKRKNLIRSISCLRDSNNTGQKRSKINKLHDSSRAMNLCFNKPKVFAEREKSQNNIIIFTLIVHLHS